ncbi:MAG: tRNA (adenosine(37)-N6)-threonylcarbamoyltransferase complex dimerization subunit type 1 TsaB [Microbacteriaceae bacterium]|nr:tRNA (adenosine(37)-N6)-threonylcarbamoyltransferase complex dimerization subunit type 1 TsaB [Microbacteriaceae bacterium]
MGGTEFSAGAPAERTLACPELSGQVLLAVDTAIGTSVAVGIGGIITEVSSDNQRGHAEMIGELIERAFALSGADPRQVTGVIVGRGPGPFTGLRIGMAAAHAFAAGRGVPLLPLQGLEAVALAVLDHGAAAPDVRVVQDARRRELFVTAFSGLDWAGAPVRTREAHLVEQAAFEPGLYDVRPDRIPAARLVQLAARRLASGAAFDNPAALYLRSPDVKPAAAIKRVSA